MVKYEKLNSIDESLSHWIIFDIFLMYRINNTFLTLIIFKQSVISSKVLGKNFIILRSMVSVWKPTLLTKVLVRYFNIVLVFWYEWIFICDLSIILYYLSTCFIKESSRINQEYSRRWRALRPVTYLLISIVTGSLLKLDSSKQV